MRRKRICIVTGNHVCHNPRAFKEADVLANAGFDVKWLGAWFDSELAKRDRLLLRNCKWHFTPVSDWSSKSLTSNLRRQRQRIRRRLGNELHAIFGSENHWQLGYCTTELFRAASTRAADLFIAHSEPALWVARKLAAKGRHVGVDMEDWFSEDLLPAARKQRPLSLLRNLEKTVLQLAKHRTCTSRAMSTALAETYKCEPPVVVYNAFPWADRQMLDGQIKDRMNLAIPSLHWFSQTIAPGRGLEDLFGALPNVRVECEIHLRGKTGPQAKQWLDSAVPSAWKRRVFVHPVVHNEQLLSRIAEHDIGVALEPNSPPNKDLTVSNKILGYLLAGLAVVASDTSGHREVAEHAAGAVTLYRAGNGADLADRLTTLLSSSELLRNARQAALETAKRTFCWERNSDALVKSVIASLT